MKVEWRWKVQVQDSNWWSWMYEQVRKRIFSENFRDQNDTLCQFVAVALQITLYRVKELLIKDPLWSTLWYFQLHRLTLTSNNNKKGKRVPRFWFQKMPKTSKRQLFWEFLNSVRLRVDSDYVKGEFGLTFQEIFGTDFFGCFLLIFTRFGINF